MVINKILRLNDLTEYIKLSRSAIYDRMNANSERFDPTFPKSFPLGGKAVGWSLEEVDAWLAQCATGISPPSLGTSPPLINEVKVNNAITGRHQRTSTTFKPRAEPETVLSLADSIVKGGQINSTLRGLLTMSNWTPAMGAMVVYGVYPEKGSVFIPDEALGLDGKTLRNADSRLRQARRLLKDWELCAEDEPLAPSELPPAEFFNWCIENSIQSDWLTLCLEFWGIRDHDTASLTAARFASLTSAS